MIILGFALGALIVAFFIFAQITGTFITPTVLRTLLAPFGILAPLALIAMLAGVLVIPIVPAVIFQIGAGLIFGPWLGLVSALVADFLGASTGFLLARYWGKALLTRFLSPEAQTQLANLTARMSWRVVIVLRLLPGPVYPFVSFAAGYSSLHFLHFTIASLIGVFPGLLLLVVAGDLVESSPVLAFAIVAFLLIGLALLSSLLNRKQSKP